MRSFVVVILLPLIALPSTVRADAPDGPVLDCVILADQEVDVGTAVPGVIEKMLVRRNDRVSSGHVVAQLESSVERATVALARARAASDAEIKLRSVELAYDKQHHSRLQQLKVRAATSSQTLEDAERVAEAARLRVRLAQDRHHEATLERRRADALLALKTIRSPIDGVVVHLHKNAGEYVEVQPVVRIARLDPLRVEVIAPLALFGKVEEGMQVAVRAETDRENERIATVRGVDAVADPGSGTFGSQLELTNPELELPAVIKCKGRLLPTPVKRTVEADQPAGSSQASPAKAAVDRPDTASDDEAATPIDAVAEAAVAPWRLRDTSGELCLVIDDVTVEDEARALVDLTAKLGGHAALDQVSETRVFGYLVVAEHDLEHESRGTLKERLLDAGVTDFAVIRSGKHAGRISLGAYSGPRFADRRRAELEELGFAAQVIPRTRRQPAWRVDVRLPADLDPAAAHAAFAQASENWNGPVVPCKPPRTAAR